MSSPLVLFDLDGTLVDSLPDIAGALNHALDRAGVAPLAVDVVRGLVGEGVLRLAERALAAARPAPASGVDPVRLAEEVRAHYRAHPCVTSVLFPGVAQMLASLHERPAIPLAVLTNKPGDVARALLEALGVARFFDAVIGDGDGFPRKPDPAAALALTARFTAAPERTLMVGDGLPDLALARAAGVPVAAALWGYTPAERLRAEHPEHALAAPTDLIPLARAL